MQTYKAFLKITLKNLPSMLVYFVVFMVIALIGTSQSSESAKEMYKDQEISFTVFNRDGSKVGEAIKEYLSEKNNYVEINDNEDSIRVALYYRDVYYAVVIPEGFEEAITKGEDMELMNYKVMDSAMGYYMDMAVEDYLKCFKAYIAGGFSVDEAITKTKDTLLDSVEVSLVEDDGNSESNSIAEQLTGLPLHYYFYQYIPYIFLAVVISGVGPIIISFSRKDVKMRINVSAQTFKSFAIQMFLGVATFGIFMLGLFNISAFILYSGTMSMAAFVYCIMNSVSFLMVCLGIAFFGGFLFKNSATMGAFTNVVSLGFSFLGGIFVPMELLGDTIKNIARFVPTYWYVQANNAIIDVQNFSDINMKEFASSLIIQLLFALAFFVAGLVVIKKKREEA